MVSLKAFSAPSFTIVFLLAQLCLLRLDPIVGLSLSRKVQQADANSPSWSLPVVEIQAPQGVQHVEKDDDQENIYQENLYVDLKPWKERQLTMKDFEAVKASHWQDTPEMPDTRRIYLIKDNKLYFVFQPKSVVECQQPCNTYLDKFYKTMSAWLLKEQFPDVLFFLNVHDFPKCRPGECKAPLLSLIKKIHKDEDILVPVPHDMDVPLYNFPWEHKIKKAFFRGTAFCSGYPHAFGYCSRTYLANLTVNMHMNHTLDVGLIGGYGLRDPMEIKPSIWRAWGRNWGPLPPAHMVSLKDHARFKYLLHLDGLSHSYRIHKIMRCNSPVFKQESEYGEWFSRSLKENVHYIKFWNTSQDDIFDVLKVWGDRDAELQKIAAEAQAFSYKYASSPARLIYWKKTLIEYKALFSGMDEYINKVIWPRIQRNGTRLTFV